MHIQRQTDWRLIVKTDRLTDHTYNQNYTQARKILHTYILVFGINFPNNYIAVTRRYFSGINFPKVAYHVFVSVSENYMENVLGIIFLENLISVTWNNVFGINFAIISGWSVANQVQWHVRPTTRNLSMLNPSWNVTKSPSAKLRTNMFHAQRIPEGRTQPAYDANSTLQRRNSTWKSTQNSKVHLNTQRAQSLKNFKIALRDWKFQARLKRMTFSSEIENFKRATHQTPYFCGEFSRSRLNMSSEIEVFKRDWKFQAKTWNFQAFKRDCFFSRFALGKLFFWTIFPLGSWLMSQGSRQEFPRALQKKLVWTRCFFAIFRKV